MRAQVTRDQSDSVDAASQLFQSVVLKQVSQSSSVDEESNAKHCARTGRQE